MTPTGNETTPGHGPDQPAPGYTTSPPPTSVIATTEPAFAPERNETITPRIAPPSVLPEMVIADDAAGVLRFTMIRVFAQGGVFAGRANVTNTASDYLNGGEVRWRILGAGGAELDRGRTTTAALAPGDTVTVQLLGSAAFHASAVAVDFDYP